MDFIAHENFLTTNYFQTTVLCGLAILIRVILVHYDT